MWHLETEALLDCEVCMWICMQTCEHTCEGCVSEEGLGRDVAPLLVDMLVGGAEIWSPWRGQEEMTFSALGDG